MWTETQILQLAPDAPTAKRGQGLASMGKWLTLRTDGNAIWGECKGSGKKPYFVQMDLKNPAFKCSCPARKFPCKHSVAIALLFVRGGDGFMMEAPPETVKNWIESRTKRFEKTEAKELEKEAVEQVKLTEERKAKTLDSRIKNIQDGLPELETWLLDTMREGIASIEKNAHQICEDIATRMSDAKMKGMATRIREIPL
ncbi:MAG: SWIM zinc finger family protein, partial [Saprospiraceae bacterium]